MSIFARILAVGLVAAPLAASSLWMAGCKQGVGERCQVQTDCDDNALCVLPAGGTPLTGGTCQPIGAADMSVDMSSPPSIDLSALDLTTSD